MKRRKVVIIGATGVLGAIALLAVMVFILVWSNLDSIVRAAIEEEGSNVTKVQVRLAEADISPTSGAGALRGLTIGNPAGYKTLRAFRLGEVAVDIDPATIIDKVIVIRAVTITGPQVTYEIGGPAGNNIDAIRRNVNAYLAPAGKKTSGPAASAAKPPDDGPRLRIKNLYIRDGTIIVSATAFDGKKLTSSLPDIHLKDIGKGTGGASPGEIIEKILSAVGDSATKSVASLDLKGVIGGAGKAVGGVMKKLTGPDSIVKTGADSVGKTLDNLFGK